MFFSQPVVRVASPLFVANRAFIGVEASVDTTVKKDMETWLKKIEETLCFGFNLYLFVILVVSYQYTLGV